MREATKPARRVRCLIGLGNPGPEYERTRHNAGFLVLARLAGPTSLWEEHWHSAMAEVPMEGEPRLLVRPLTYMNRSGPEVARILDAAGLAPSECLVISDDVTLPLGRLRIRPFGSSGGQRGLRSIEQALGTSSYPRLRVGVGEAPPGVDLADHVLEPLQGELWAALEEATERAAEAVRTVLREGLDRAMTRWNAPAPGGGGG
ncbi:MAG: aminoacyl-tRNA hydrolase [Candidatus Eisenbacteria bacterium]